ncbi:hypothetical protein I9H06_15945 [Pseudomonas tremae]|nr:hypothetical protein I9H06_15945 [Pseudomonas tremae]UQB39470.1 hypothetical protein I9H09_09580 [Pseudomonas tremae]
MLGDIGEVIEQPHGIADRASINEADRQPRLDACLDRLIGRAFKYHTGLAAILVRR